MISPMISFNSWRDNTPPLLSSLILQKTYCHLLSEDIDCCYCDLFGERKVVETNLMTMSSLTVNVSVEPLDEYQVQEITYDGQEKYIQWVFKALSLKSYWPLMWSPVPLVFRPLSMSENLTKMVQKIDFTKVGDGDDLKTGSNEESSSETKELATFQPSLWPLDSVRNKLKYLWISFD